MDWHRWSVQMQRFFRILTLLTLWIAQGATIQAAPSVPTDIQAPGTQPGEVQSFTSPTNCDNCHGGTENPAFEPAHGWRGSMMGNATRDPLFWATLAVAEQDFVPNADPDLRGGAGDFCLRCHSVNGWVSGRSTPTDGSGLSATADINGVECEFCHLLVNPDPPTNVAGTVEEQNPPFEAYDPVSGEAYRGAAQYVLNSDGTRLGPYSNAVAKHQFFPSAFHRQAELCATCHDVSNPAVGDLAPNNGAQQALSPGTYSGQLGGNVSTKAAFNNPPYKYGVVERTYSEWVSSAFDTTLVQDFPSLPSDLKAANGALSVAYHRAYDARSNANYEDGTPRYFTCQTCHMAAATGVGCNKPGVPTRTDLPRHDLTGSGYWMPDVIQYMDGRGTLRLGSGLNAEQISALNDSKVRAQQLLLSAASIQATQVGSALLINVKNLTGHKLISGYPEGRRMWLNIRWYDSGGILLHENGAYGPIGRTANDLDGVAHQVESILDPASTVVYEAHGGMDQSWASKLVTSFAYNSGLPLSYNRITDAVDFTLGDLASSAVGTSHETFHFVLNNTMVSDNRIPPYMYSYDEARTRNALPVPETQFGDPGPGGSYRYWDESYFSLPSGAVTAEIRLMYQQTSWEYIQFLWLQNDGLNTFLGNEGVNLLDAWLKTGMSSPLEIASYTVSGLTPPTPGSAGALTASWNSGTGKIDVAFEPGCGAEGHTVYYGDLGSIASYTYEGSECFSGSAGTLSFTPPSGSIFFVIAENNGDVEGSYGVDSTGVERPEATGLSCDFPQDLVNGCTSP